VLADSIVYVPDEWVSNVTQVSSDLVKAARFRFCFDERIAIFEGPKAPEMCFGIDPLAFWNPGNRGVDDPFIGGNASNECNVGFLYTTFFKGDGYRPRRIFIQGENKGTTGGTI